MLAAADAVVYLRGRSGTTHYLLYLPTDGSSGDGGDTANFTSLAPKVRAGGGAGRDCT
jgi:hypothetical protein